MPSSLVEYSNLAVKQILSEHQKIRKMSKNSAEKSAHKKLSHDQQQQHVQAIPPLLITGNAGHTQAAREDDAKKPSQLDILSSPITKIIISTTKGSRNNSPRPANENVNTLQSSSNNLLTISTPRSIYLNKDRESRTNLHQVPADRNLLDVNYCPSTNPQNVSLVGTRAQLVTEYQSPATLKQNTQEEKSLSPGQTNQSAADQPSEPVRARYSPQQIACTSAQVTIPSPTRDPQL